MWGPQQVLLVGIREMSMREKMRPRDKRQEEIPISKCDAANGDVMLNSEIILR